MDAFVSAGLLNAGLATLLALGAAGATAIWRNPYVARIAWLAVLLKLVTPPLLFVPMEMSWVDRLFEPAPTIVVSVPDVVTSSDHQATLSDQGAAAPPSRSAGFDSVVLAEASSEPVALPQLIEPPVSLPQAMDKMDTMPAEFQWRDLLLPLGWAWIVGSVGLGALALVRIGRFHRAVSRSSLASAPLQARAAEIAARLGLRSTPPIRVVAGRIAPLAWSLGPRATIVLPSALLETLDHEADHEALDAVLAHELTHIERRDGWARWLELAAGIAYWWCPTVWIARKRIHEAEELCCDADVLRQFPALRRGYGRAMLETLELLASDAALAPGATGWGSRRSLRRRFERLGRGESAPALGAWKRRTCWVAIVLLCLLAPTAVSSEQPVAAPVEVPAAIPVDPPADEEAATAAAATTGDESRPCTIVMNDGSIINGMLVDEGGERLVVLRDKTASNDSMPERTDVPQLDKGEASSKPWGLTLKECVRMALENHPGYRLASPANASDLLMLSQVAEKPQSRTVFETGAETLVLEVAENYWELHFAWEEVAIRRDAMAAALELWRRVKVKHSAMVKGGSTADEAQTRGQFFHCQEQLQSAQSQLYRLERKLRMSMGLASYDGRTILPSTPLTLEDRPIVWRNVQTVALAKRVEVREQAKRVDEHQRRQREAEALVVEKQDPTLAERKAQADAQYAKLLADREAVVLQRMQRSVSDQLADAVRDLELKYAQTRTSGNRNKAARDEVAAVEATYDVGRVTLDLLLQSQQHTAEAAAADERSRVDYQQADLQFQRRQGTLLETLGIHIAE